MSARNAGTQFRKASIPVKEEKSSKDFLRSDLNWGKQLRWKVLRSWIDPLRKISLPRFLISLPGFLISLVVRNGTLFSCGITTENFLSSANSMGLMDSCTQVGTYEGTLFSCENWYKTLVSSTVEEEISKS